MSHHRQMTNAPWSPELQLSERSGCCQLTLVGITYGVGHTLQEAATDLVVRVYDLAMGLRRGMRFSSEMGRMAPEVIDYLGEIGEILRRGGDIRVRVLGDAPALDRRD